MFLNKIGKSISDGFRRLPETVIKAYRTFNQAKTTVQKALPEIQAGIEKGKEVYDKVVVPNTSKEFRDKIESKISPGATKLYNIGSDAVDKINKADEAITRTAAILQS